MAISFKLTENKQKLVAYVRSTFAVEPQDHYDLLEGVSDQEIVMLIGGAYTEAGAISALKDLIYERRNFLDLQVKEAQAKKSLAAGNDHPDWPNTHTVVMPLPAKKPRLKHVVGGIATAETLVEGWYYMHKSYGLCQYTPKAKKEGLFKSKATKEEGASFEFLEDTKYVPKGTVKGCYFSNITVVGPTLPVGASA